MKVNSFIANTTTRLERAGISTARLDCLVLLEDVLNTNRTQLLADGQRDITEVELLKLDELIAKRAQHIPLAYLRGRTEFYGREFVVSEAVLEPRPESETIIDILKNLVLQQPIKLLDVGSGSGALGITAALELPAEVTLLDIDPGALAISKQNAQLHNVSAHFIQNDLLEGIDEPFDVLLCNLPYVPDNFQLNTAATHEPRLAIFGGHDGLDLYRRLFEQLSRSKRSTRYVLTESLPPQHPSLVEIATQSGYREARKDDFIQLFVPSS